MTDVKVGLQRYTGWDITQDENGLMVYFDDAQAALAAKDEELAHLRNVQTAMQDEYATQLDASRKYADSLIDTNNKLKHRLDTLLGEAVWAMELVQHEAHYWEAKAVELELDHPFVLEQLKRNETYQRASAFLARPDVQALQARQKEGA